MVAKEHNLPQGWAVTTLGEVIDSAIKQGVPDGGNFLYVDISSIDSATKKIVAPKLLSTSKPPSRARQHLLSNDVLVSMTRPNLNAVALLPEDAKHAIGSTGFHVLRPLYVNPKWLFYLVQTDRFINRLSGFVQGALYPAVRPKDINGFHFDLPPLIEQQRIVAEVEKQLARFDEGIAALTRIKDDLALYRAATLKAACEGRLVPSEATLARQERRDYEPASELLRKILKRRSARWERDQLSKMKAQRKRVIDNRWKEKYVNPEEISAGPLPEPPEGWIWARAEQLCELITKGTTPSASRLFSGQGEIPFIKVYNLTDSGQLDFSVNPTFISIETHKQLSRSKVFPRDVLMNIVGPPLGKVSIVPDSYKEWNINQAIAIFRPVAGLDNKFLTFLLLTNKVLTWATRRAKTTAGQFNLTLEICRDLPLPLPPLPEQKRIVAEVERRLHVIEEIEETVAFNVKRAKELRRSILKRAFAGSLVPQNPNEEPASVLLERIAVERHRRAEEIMKEKKRKTRSKTNESKPSLFKEEPKGIFQGLRRLGQTASIETVFQDGYFKFEPNDEGEFADVDAFFDELAQLLTKSEVMFLRHPEEMILKRREVRLSRRRSVRRK